LFGYGKRQIQKALERNKKEKAFKRRATAKNSPAQKRVDEKKI